MRKFSRVSIGFILVFLLCSPNLYAVTQLIGDADGFGFDPTVVPELEGNRIVDATTTPKTTEPLEGGADINNNGILDIGDVLPDLYTANGPIGVLTPGQDGYTDGRDFFDNRELDEVNNADGANFTDITLSSRALTNLQGEDPGKSFYQGLLKGEFPGLAKDAKFTFLFDVPKPGEHDYEKDHYVSLIYGDYDVGDMAVYIDEEKVKLESNDDAELDGYIGLAYAVVSWDRMLDGKIEIRVEAETEPFVAFDLVSLDLQPGIPLPVIGVAKKVKSIEDIGSGKYVVTYEILVKNVGIVDLLEVQVKEDLSQTFSGANPKIVNTPISIDFKVNSDFDGINNVLLLDGTDELSLGEDGVIELAVEVTPGENLGPYDNTAIATARGPYGDPTSDESNDYTGVEPDPVNQIDPVDPDGDKNPDEDGENTPTSVIFPEPVPETPVIGLAKKVVSVKNNGNDTYIVTYEILVKNVGMVDLLEVQVIEDLSQTFEKADEFNFVSGSLSSSTLAVNSELFDGVNDTRLLTATDTLQPGESGTIQLAVNVKPGDYLGPYDNTAVGTAHDKDGNETTDTSNDDAGVDPDPVDPDGDKNPNEDGENTPTVVSFGETPGTDPNQPPVPTPIPEPGTMILLGAGLVGILALRRRKRN